MALRFTAASSQYLSWNAALVTAAPCSFACWYNPATLSASQTAMSVCNVSAISYFGLFPETSSTVAAQSQAGVGTLTDSGNVIPIGSWSHIAAVFISSTSLKVYINGSVATLTGSATSPNGLVTSLIGVLNHSGAFQAFADASIAYPAIWGAYALTQTDINNLYNSGAGLNPSGIQNGSLVSFLEMQSGTPYFDQILSATWTVHGAPTLVADPFSIGGTSPTVTEQSPSSITSSGAIFNGTITNLNAGGNVTVRGFNYGITTGYGVSTQSSGSFGTGAFALTVTGLAPGITYNVQAFSTNPGGTGLSANQTFTTSAGGSSNKGEVLFFPSPTGQLSNGTTASGSIANLFEGSNQTTWTTSSTAAWAGIDCGASITLTRLRYTAQPGAEDLSLGATLNASLSDPTFASPVLLSTLSASVRPSTGTLQNEVDVSPGAPYRYYMVQSATGLTFGFADLDFIGTWASGVFARPVSPVITPPGGNLGEPTVVRIASITTSATIYYTTDGSTPTTSSTQYTVPFVVSSTAIVNAIAFDSQLTKPSSRITASYFIIGQAILYSHQFIYDDRNYRVTSMEGPIFQDPVSGWWYLHLFDSDNLLGDVTGQNVYKSADIRNWIYQGNICGAAIGSQTGSDFVLVRGGVLYNTNTRLYVKWLGEDAHESGGVRVYTSTYPDATVAWTLAATYTATSPLGDGYTGGGGSFYGDIAVFVDPVSGNAYLIYNYSSNTQTAFSQLDPANYTNTLSTGHASYASNREGHAVCYKNGTYFWLSSGEVGPMYSVNTYSTSSTPIGPWSATVNPFQMVSGGPSSNTAYNSQTTQILFMPGRNAYVYLGEDGGITSGVNQYFVTRLQLPIAFPTSTSMTITWQSTAQWPDPNTAYANGFSPWSLDAVFPTVSGGPIAVTGLSITTNTATWTNNDSIPSYTYLDNAPDTSFSSGVISEVVTFGAASFVVTPSVQTGTYFRVRSVNANGTSVSNIYPGSSGPNNTPSSGSVTGTFNLTWNADLARCAIEIENVSEEDGKQPKELRRVYRQILAEITKPYRI